jgi:hypothetical protein
MGLLLPDARGVNVRRGELQFQTHTRGSPEPHGHRRKVGKLTSNFVESSRSPEVPKTWKQSTKR